MKSTNTRNMSAIYLFNRNSAILMDCSDATYSQIYDHFGTREKVADVLLKTRVIFITHMHCDHSTGILKVLYQRDKIIK